MTGKETNWGSTVAQAAKRFRDGELYRTTGVDRSNRDARLLLAHVLGVTPERVFSWPECPLAEGAEKSFFDLVERRLKQEPLSRILGRREFWSLSFQLSADTLDPRPDSESVIEAVLTHRPDIRPDYRILDLGTGTGCLLAALLSEYTNATGTAVDVSEGAVRTAGQNLIDLGFASRASVRTGNWDEGLDGTFDIIVSNPPYIIDETVPALEVSVAAFDPHLALKGGRDGLDAYRQLAGLLPARLSESGLAVLEFGHGQADQIAGILAEKNLEVIDWKEDLSGRRRCAVCQIRS
jgi:release factor glutamine methyltransferase